MSKQISIKNKHDRVVVLVDMDCFYCQVEAKLDPVKYKGKPLAVVQYNDWKGGGIIAVNYEARNRGVTRHMRGDQAKEHCPDIELARVPCVRGKADLSKYRDAGKEVVSVLQTFTPTLERASVDEAYLDITDNVVERLQKMNEGLFKLEPQKLINTYAVGFKTIGEYIQTISNSNGEASDELQDLNEDMTQPEDYMKSDIKLLIGASLVNEIRKAVKDQTGYECSAGIAHNKILAKLVCGLNKPNKQTILPLKKLQTMFSTLPINKVRGLGGKFGDIISEKFNVKFMGDFLKFSEKELQNKLDDKNGSWLYLMSRGINLECVIPRMVSKSIGCCKNFPGKSSILGIATLQHWLNELANDMVERLEKDVAENNRRARLLTVSFTQTIDNVDISSSRCTSLDVYDTDKMAKEGFELIKRNTVKFLTDDANQKLNNPIKLLGLSASKFENNNDANGGTIKEMFSNQTKNDVKRNVTESSVDKVLPTESTEQPSFFKQHIEHKETSDALNTSDESKSSEEPTHFIEGIPIASPTKESNNIADSKELSDEKRVTPSDPCENFEIGECSKSVTARDIPDYKSTYVEYKKLPTDELQLVSCKECDKKIAVNELQSHKDFHYAVKISREIRNAEIRKDPQPKVVTKIEKTAKGMKGVKAKKTALSQPQKAPANTIVSFFDKNQPKQAATVNQSDGTEMCKQCGKLIAADALVTHLDYHLAFEIHNKLNRVAQEQTKAVHEPPTKRARGADEKTVKKSSDITRFFQK